jgi:hypothetical protein
LGARGILVDRVVASWGVLLNLFACVSVPVVSIALVLIRGSSSVAGAVKATALLALGERNCWTRANTASTKNCTASRGTLK